MYDNAIANRIYGIRNYFYSAEGGQKHKQDGWAIYCELPECYGRGEYPNGIRLRLFYNYQ